VTNKSEGSTPGWVARLAEANWVEPVLGTLVAIYGISTAWAAYQAGIYGGNSSENFFVAQSSLTDSSFFYNQANQEVQHDLDMITEIEVQTALGAPDEAVDALVNALSEDALVSFERAGDLDDQYYNDKYVTAEEYETNAQNAFAAAKAWDELGDTYELLVLVLAVGLGFAGWASLIHAESMLRYVFGVLAVIALVIGIVITVDLMSKPTPVMVDLVGAGETQ
jgi:hypothetical protein